MLLGGFFSHPKTLLPYPSAKAYFLCRSAVHLQEELTFGLLKHALFSKVFSQICSCVQHSRRLISSWCWHGGDTERARVILEGRNTCLSIAGGWRVNQHLFLHKFTLVLVTFSTSHLLRPTMVVQRKVLVPCFYSIDSGGLTEN